MKRSVTLLLGATLLFCGCADDDSHAGPSSYCEAYCECEPALEPGCQTECEEAFYTLPSVECQHTFYDFTECLEATDCEWFDCAELMMAIADCGWVP